VVITSCIIGFQVRPFISSARWPTGSIDWQRPYRAYLWENSTSLTLYGISWPIRTKSPSPSSAHRPVRWSWPSSFYERRDTPLICILIAQIQITTMCLTISLS
jgi:hypothetical protein